MIATASKYSQIIRQNGTHSLQPRFSKVSPDKFFTSLLRFVNSDIQNEPQRSVNSTIRDSWLRRVWPQEPYLAGVINSVVSIDKNRGWTITGGRNQVKRFVDIIHNRFYFAPDLTGWRMSFGGSALSYYTSDIGSVTELGRNGEDGPLDSLYFVDPARCTLTGNFDSPLKYRPASGGNEQVWRSNDYFRVVSLPDTDEATYGLGYCALSRCIELAKIMIGIYQYDNEMLLNRAPRGLLLLKGITQEQWEDAMQAREARLDGDEKKYYGAVNILASLDPGVELDAQLVALSSLPAEFNQQIFTDLLMYGYSVCFGYDPREFWPVSAGALGTATETEAQHRKAGGKGGLDFTLGFAERLQEELPNTLQFEFEERDLDGELANATVEQAQADVVTSIYESGLREGAPLITQQQGQILLAEKGLIDPEWTENQEETVATDTEDDVNRALQNERVQRAIWKYPNEPIVQYSFRVENGREKKRYKTLLEPRRIRRTFYSFGQMIRRQQGGTIDEELEDYQEQIGELSRQANDGEISQVEFRDRLNALTIAVLTLALARGSGNTNDAQEILTDASLDILSGDNIDVSLGIITDPNVLNAAFEDDAIEALTGDIDGSLQSTLAGDIYAGQYTDNAQGLQSRLAMWGLTALGLYALGRMIARPETMFQWRLGATLNHCTDCSRLDSQVHSGADWRASGWRPQGRNLACTGRRCDCGLYEVDLPASGEF